MRYIKLFENFSDNNIEENLEALLVDLTDNGYGYVSDITDAANGFSVEIYKGDTAPNDREHFNYDNDDDDEFEVSDVRDEVLYLSEYMLAKLGPDYNCYYLLETKWEQFTVYSIIEGEYDEVYDEANVLDLISLTVIFDKKPK